jgi:hypothetical protein
MWRTRIWFLGTFVLLECSGIFAPGLSGRVGEGFPRFEGLFFAFVMFSVLRGLARGRDGSGFLIFAGDPAAV